MAQFINHFVRVDQAWSYNMIGGLKEHITIDMHVINDIYTKAASYLVARHNFFLTQNGQQFNQLINAMSEHMESFYVGWKYFQYYFNNLFLIISPALGQIRYPITKVTTIVTDAGEIEGFVFGT